MQYLCYDVSFGGNYEVSNLLFPPFIFKCIILGKKEVAFRNG